MAALVIFEGEDPWTTARSADSDAFAAGINEEKPFGSESHGSDC